ncbi:hypothetical protein [Pseudorhodoplanes sp.]|uniref:hypothetical protein n=1 Tax=Pseudorhodoplanes sp. TaxID=1934341 RepID=UPI002C6CAFB6|nr:hypothetical protein [Pseudorhodoplanes sp.]HWV53391.1 hypothetical protein [Pseudorhodoplanes sp.]
MIISLSAGKHELLERNDYGRLSLRAPSGWSSAEIEGGLPFKVECTTDHIWIKESDLRVLAQIPATASDPISGMLEKARKYGFYNDATGTVRVHIEYY